MLVQTLALMAAVLRLVRQTLRKEQNMKSWSVVSLACCLFCLPGFFCPGLADAATLKERMELALSRTEGAMEGVRARSDVVFMVTQASHLTGRKASLALDKSIYEQRNEGWVQETEYKLWEARDKKLPRVSMSMPLKADAVLPSPKVMLSTDQRFLLVFVLMQRAISCTDGFNVYRDVGEPYFDYVSAHQLLSILIAGGNGCLGSEAFSRSIQPYIQRVYSEMIGHKGGFTDLQVERAAFLALAGRPDLVAPDMIEGLLNSQSSKGVWVFDMQPEHTTALAYLLLSAVYAARFQ